MTIVLNPYGKMFCYAWDIYSTTLTRIRKWSADYGIRIDEVYLPTTYGSKETAHIRWSNILDEVKIGKDYVTEDMLATAVELYCKDRENDFKQSRKARMPMMSVFLNIKPKNDRDVEILDFIRLASEQGGKNVEQSS